MPHIVTEESFSAYAFKAERSVKFLSIIVIAVNDQTYFLTPRSKYLITEGLNQCTPHSTSSKLRQYTH